MSLFGWTIIRKSELEQLESQGRIVSRLIQVHRWFSGWKDLDIIWAYLFNPQTDISPVRDDYAKARGTDCYGKVSAP
jgi:hypothetical protein